MQKKKNNIIKLEGGFLWKKFLPILILVVVAFAFGCTRVSEKTFSGDGINIPVPWNLEEQIHK